MKKENCFEYRVVKGEVDFPFSAFSGSAEDELVLNKLGDDGWELIGFFEGSGRPEGGIGSKRLVYFFKRAKD